MSEQLDLNLKTARLARDEGIALSSAKNAGWMDVMLGHLRAWLSGKAGAPFTMELFRGQAKLDRLPEPTDHHAWGALTRAAQAAGMIYWTGRYEEASSKKTHAHPVKVWRAR